MSELLDRVPPHNLEAEAACIGAMLMNSYAVLNCIQHLDQDDFYDGKNKIIFKAISNLHDKNIPVDIVSVSDYLTSSGEIERSGGSAYLSKTVEGVPCATNVGYYIKIVIDKSMLRNLINTCSNIIDNVYEYQSDVTWIFDKAESSIIEASERRNRDDKTIPISQSLTSVLQRTFDMADGKIPYHGIFTGYKRIDECIDGILPGNLVIIGGLFAGGKTALAIKMMMTMYDNSKEEIPALYFTLEMKEDEITKRMLSIQSRVDYHIIRRPKFFTHTHKQSILEAAVVLERKKIHLNDKPRLNIMNIKAITRRMWRKHKIKVIFIDHLQIVGLEKTPDSRNDKLGSVSAGLKELAKELNIVVVVLSQLNKEGGVRDSANPEQDADIVMKLERKEGERQAKLKITKSRETKLDTIDMIFNGNLMEFNEADEHTGNF